jgi:hypothetical protein
MRRGGVTGRVEDWNVGSDKLTLSELWTESYSV